MYNVYKDKLCTMRTRINYKTVPVTSLYKYLHYGVALRRKPQYIF